ncbi:unnamed protein product [Sphacelaria rigidula]
MGQSKQDLEKALLARHHAIAACNVGSVNIQPNPTICSNSQQSIWQSPNLSCHHCAPTCQTGNPTLSCHNTVAAFSNQPASVPGQHGVPFSGKTQQFNNTSHTSTYQGGSTPTTTQGQVGTATISNPPSPDSPRTEITDFLRNARICFRHAFGVECRRPRCPYIHEVNILPRGFYSQTYRSQPGSAKRTHQADESEQPNKRRRITVSPEQLEMISAITGLEFESEHEDGAEHTT